MGGHTFNTFSEALQAGGDYGAFKGLAKPSESDLRLPLSPLNFLVL